MNQSEAALEVKKLKRIAALKIDNLGTWLALIEDELKSTIPDSELFRRFSEIKQSAGLEKDRTGGSAPNEIRNQCRELIDAVCERLSSAPLQSDDLTDEVERIIQKGYFESVWFRAVVGGLALVLLLVTGVEGYKLNEQVKAMQELVENARRQVEDGRVYVAQATKENSEQQGKLALMILQNNTDMVKMQGQAIQQMANQEQEFETKTREETKRWTDQIENEDGPAAVKKVRDAGETGSNRINSEITGQLNSGEAHLAEHLSAAMSSLDAADRPWVPRILWSMSKTWLIVPFSLLIALLAWLHALTQRIPFLSGYKWGNIVTIANIGALIVATVIFFRLK